MFSISKDGDRSKSDVSGKANPASASKSAPLVNRAWQTLALAPGRIQPKLAISQPHDPLEQEADRVAESVMRDAMPSLNHGTAHGSPTLQRMCNECEEEETGVMRKAESESADTGGAAPPIVSEVLTSTGQPLDRATRSFMEPRFGSDFSDVRVHTGGRAADSASAVSARAYTVNRDIVFASGEYAPDSLRGRRLLSHELAHVMQQGTAAGNVVHRQTDFGEMYKDKQGKVKSHLGVEYDAYKQKLGKTEFSSATGGHRFPMAYPITRDELLQVFTGVAKDLKNSKVDESVVDSYVQKLNQAFRMFKIDTVEAQASYIANAWNESDQFRSMTETQKSTKGNRQYESDPSKVKLDLKWLNEAATGTVTDPDGSKRSVVNYEPGGSIHPMKEKDWQQSFIGRGPIQVTHRHTYVQVLAVMENRADELKKLAEDFAQKKKDEGSTNANEITPRVSQDEQDLREAIAKIKADPREAADPKYAFMFSAGFMKMADDKGVRGDVKATRGSVTSWMGQQPAEAEKNKQKAYALAYSVLMKKWKADTNEDQHMFD